MTLLQLIARLEELEKKATPGPWEYVEGDYTDPEDIYDSKILNEKSREQVPAFSVQPPGKREFDLEFITELHNALPQLLEFCKEAIEQQELVASLLNCLDELDGIIPENVLAAQDSLVEKWLDLRTKHGISSEPKV